MEFAGKKKKKIVFVRYNPSAALRAAPPLTQGRLGSAPPVVKMKFHTAGAYGMPPYEVRISPNRGVVAPPPTGFVRTLRVTSYPQGGEVAAKRQLISAERLPPGGGWRRQAAGGERATLKLDFLLDTARQTLGATTI